MALLAVSIDQTETRPNIPAYLEKHGIRSRVLLGDPEHPEGYETNAAGILYMVDRKGFLAGVPGEFEPDMEKKAERRIAQLLSPDAASGPLLFELERAPAGFEILWKRPLRAEVTALGLAPPCKGHPAEIGVLDESHLRRYSEKGEPLGEAEVDAKEAVFLEGGDLDGDGRNEWIVGGGKSLSVLDSAGTRYWGFPSLSQKLRFAGMKSLQGEGSLNIVVHDGTLVIARKTLPGTLWFSSPLSGLKSVIPDPEGAFLVQTDSGIQALDRQGHLAGATVKVPPGAVLAGRIARPKGGAWNLFSFEQGPDLKVLNQFMKTGQNEILTSEPGMVSVYSLDAKPVLRLRLSSSVNYPVIAAGDLDGRPGDEIVLFVPQYGLVALGVTSNSISGEDPATSSRVSGASGVR